MAASKRDEQFLTIIDGWIRRENDTLGLRIPHVINMVILSFYKVVIDSRILTDNENATLYEMVLNQLQVKIMNFESIYQGTKDGFGFDNFWNKCDAIKPAFVIIETVSNKVFGGYTSVGLTKKEVSTDKNAFIYVVSIRLDYGYNKIVI